MNVTTNNGGVGIAWLGFIINLAGNRVSWEYGFLISFVGIIIAVVGCVLWAQRKNRHWAFGLWGIIAPIGILGVSLLKDKQHKTIMQPDGAVSWETEELNF